MNTIVKTVTGNNETKTVAVLHSLTTNGQFAKLFVDVLVRDQASTGWTFVRGHVGAFRDGGSITLFDSTDAGDQGSSGNFTSAAIVANGDDIEVRVFAGSGGPHMADCLIQWYAAQGK